MMSNQNNIPQLRFHEFEGVMKEIKFGKVVQSNIYGPRFNANDYSDVGNVKTIRGTDLGSDGEIKYDQVPLALLDEKMVNTHKLLEGDIVMITTAECGATGVYRKQEIDFLSSAYGVRLRLNEQGYPYYFKYFFQTHQAKKEINSYIRKSTIANLPGSDILRIKVFLPTLPEQQKIASFLSAVDEKIQQLFRKKELLEQYKKGVMQQLFSGKLRFKDENGNDYADWEEKKLGECLDYIQPTKYLVSSTEYDNSYNTPVLTAGKTFILGYTNETNGIFENNLPVIIFDDFTTATKFVDFPFKAKSSAMKILVPFEGVSIKFIYESMQIMKYEIGGHERHWISKFSQILMPFPSLPEQQKIATFLSNIDAKIESCSQQINQTQSFKKGLLQQLFV